MKFVCKTPANLEKRKMTSYKTPSHLKNGTFDVDTSIPFWKKLVAKFKNGIKQGLWLVYDDKGRILTEVFYKDDKKISASQHIYANN